MAARRERTVPIPDRWKRTHGWVSPWGTRNRDDEPNRSTGPATDRFLSRYDCSHRPSSHPALDVRDDGVGISEHVEPSDGVGIHVMQYRAHLIGADLDVEPVEDGGTLVRCRLPLEAVS